MSNDKEMPEKADLKSLDISAENRDKLQQLFPSVFTETKGEKGELIESIDFEKLKAELGTFSDVFEARRERYGMDWPGKKDCMKLIQKPSIATLKPCREESVNFDETENLFIEGDNLEVLKLLQKSYYGKVKMIYIDPPYNTGKEFIYPDDYSESLDTYLAYAGLIDDEGKKFSTNTANEGRFHTKWLNMLFPRLYLARNLLRDDGLVFISIGDHEVANLRTLCDQIFGEENFVTQFIWATEGHTDNQFQVKVNHEYIILYSKSASNCTLGYVVDPNTREASNLWKGFAENSITKTGPGNPPSEITLEAGFPCAVNELELDISEMDQRYFSEVESVGYITRAMTRKYSVTYPIRLDTMTVADGKLAKKCRVYSGWANANKLKQFIAGGYEPIVEDNGDILSFYLSSRGVIYYRRERQRARNILSVLRNMGTTEQMRYELERLGIDFEYPKPKELLKYLIRIGCIDAEIILDFFAGSCVTARAVLEVNQEDKMNHQFLMVQLPEPTDENSEAFRTGFKTIADIGKGHIRNFLNEQGTQEDNPQGDILASHNEEPHDTDLGFKVLKLDISNFKVWDGSKQEPTGEQFAEQLEAFIEHVDPKATQEDILFELLLKAGFKPTEKTEKKKFAGKTVFSIADDLLLICLEDEITKELIEAIAEAEPLQFICLDRGFKGNDQLKANAVQTFAARSQGRDRQDQIVFRTV